MFAGGLEEGVGIRHERKPSTSRTRARREWPAALGLAALLGVGCRCSSDPPSATVAVSTPPAQPACVRGSAQLTLAAAAEPRATEPPLDPDLELPFATEPGMALAARAGFVATALQHEPRGAVALLGRVGADDAPTQLVELGHVRGEVLPPRVAGDAGDLWVVLQDGTGPGRELRVGRFENADLSAPARWRQGPSQPNAESSAFDIAASASGALLVYEEWAAAGNHGRIVAAPLARDLAGEGRLEGKPVTLPGTDAEAPRVSARRGGYWLAWLVNTRAPAPSRTGPEEQPEP
ncbi:MAG TPA: hypothetical protein VNN80_15585, partial [Polyangiaceae bacterium]|nr:hypothetical protein [Polyangiaceae bacterium]